MPALQTNHTLAGMRLENRRPELLFRFLRPDFLPTFGALARAFRGSYIVRAVLFLLHDDFRR